LDSVLQPWNNFFLIVVEIWLQTGFAMVLFSAAIKGIPVEIMEAAQVDGANEVQVFFRIMLPQILGTTLPSQPYCYFSLLRYSMWSGS